MVKNFPANAEMWVQSLVGKIPWRKKWKPTPVFLLGKSHEQRSLEGYSLWGHKQLDTVEQLRMHAPIMNIEAKILNNILAN